MLDFVDWFLSWYGFDLATWGGLKSFYAFPMLLEFYAMFAGAALMLFFALIAALMHFKRGRE